MATSLLNPGLLRPKLKLDVGIWFRSKFDVKLLIAMLLTQYVAIEQDFHVIQLLWALYKVVLSFKSVDETLVCNHSNESYLAVLSCDTVCYAVQCKVVLTFNSVDETLDFDHSSESYWALHVHVLSCGKVFMLFQMVLSFKTLNETLMNDNGNERHQLMSVVTSILIVLSIMERDNFFCQILFLL